MKDLMVERAVNGWIVRPRIWEPGVCAAAESMHVYTRIEDLQAALPALLGVPSPSPIVIPAPSVPAWEEVTYAPADRTPPFEVTCATVKEGHSVVSQ